MRRTRHLTLAAALSALALLITGPAGALSVGGTALADTTLAGAALAPESFADKCVSGPAAEASALLPHVWSAEGHSGLVASPHGERADLRAGWIGVTEGGTFTANIQTTDLSTHPVNTRFNFTYGGPLGEHFVTAEAIETLEFAFSFGHLDTTQTPNRLVTDGDTTGSVDIDNATITIDLPAEAVPAPPTDGREVRMPIIGIEAQLLAGTSATGGLLLITDESSRTCQAVLYEAEPTTEP